MKHFQSYFIILLVMFLLSCGKDDADKDLLYGNWTATKLITSGCTDPSENSDISFTSGCYEEVLVGLKLCLSATFNNNGTYTIVTKTTFLGSTSTDTESGTFKIDGSKISLCETGDDCEDATFSVSKNTLTINSKDSDTKCSSTLTMSK